MCHRLPRETSDGSDRIGRLGAEVEPRAAASDSKLRAQHQITELLIAHQQAVPRFRLRARSQNDAVNDFLLPTGLRMPARTISAVKKRLPTLAERRHRKENEDDPGMQSFIHRRVA